MNSVTHRSAGPTHHDSLREGLRLGLTVATAIWLWIAVVDVIAGQPLHTFSMLGGVVVFTILHYLLNVVYAIVVVSAIHGAEREPSLVIAVAFGFVFVSIALMLLTVLLSNVGLGRFAWVRILGGHLLGGAIALRMLWRRHPLAEELRKADEQV